MFTINSAIGKSKAVYAKFIKNLEYDLYDYAKNGKNCLNFYVKKDFVPLVQEYLKKYDVKVTIKPDYDELWWSSSKEHLYTDCIFTITAGNFSMFLEEPFTTIIENNIEADLQKEFESTLANVCKQMNYSAVDLRTYCELTLEKEIGEKIKMFLQQEGLCVEIVRTIPPRGSAYSEEIYLRISWAHLI